MREVSLSSELRRVLALPRRQWTEAEAARMARELTALLKTPEGTMELRPIQAVALIELAQAGGLFAPIRVGGGKTLISALAPIMVGAARPLLLVPGKLAEKTRREIAELRRHWRIPELLRVMSYQELSHPNANALLDKDGKVITPDILERYEPDLVFADEGHRLKRPGSAATKRVRRYRKRHPCKFAVTSGTFATRSIRDYGHLIVWALGRKAPVPVADSQREDWACALDDETVGLGALTMLGGTDLDSVRRAYRDRLTSSVGVVTYDCPFQGVGLDIRRLPLEAPAAVAEALAGLRDRWELPDGSPLCESLELWRHARELALGFFLRWEPAPPREWMDARKEWSTECRRLVGDNRRNLDSPKPVIDAVLKGLYPEAKPLLERWRAVEKSYTPKTVPVWLHPFAAEAAAAWLDEEGIAWTEHDAFAERVSSLSGASYFSAQAKNADGVHLMDASGPVVASWHSCGEGLNLQQWARNLITSPPSNGKILEQLIGRTHREGQARDVLVDWFATCEEHDAAFERAQNDARYVEATTGLQQKVIANGIVG